MNLTRWSTFTFAGLACLFGFVGCQRENEAPEPTSQIAPTDAPETAEKMPSMRDERFAAAVAAKDDLFQTLSGRLMEVMQTEGPVAAIRVCSEDAPKIAQTVADEHGVEIGRTSWKLRNPNNAPRDWVQPFVDEKVDLPQTVALEDGRLGVTFPIRLDVKCLMCHGGPDDMLDSVKPELAKRYPDDQATGFKAGDLRGMFWVEVPAT
ncbi:Tll0287-like domain-containing protein [Crateriforma spongiae]|uniref:Tll0287-like domain-containing protein n=1 Tax=Crateriforma spongiae TaxID=2724528 RepID=UPI001446430E|nr:DUF3365 domain-containing protein [Crateriforma spongiae]